MNIAERFEAKVELIPFSECHWWVASLHNTGYGQLSSKRGQRPHYAHRLAYELYIGSIPDGMWVLHNCDNRMCVNPAHLFLGTYRDNIDDKVAKGRQAKGEDIPGAKLTEEQVIEIYQSTESERVLAQVYDVNRSTIGYIRRQETWKEVTRGIV